MSADILGGRALESYDTLHSRAPPGFRCVTCAGSSSGSGPEAGDAGPDLCRQDFHLPGCVGRCGGLSEKYYRRRSIALLRKWHISIEPWIWKEAGIEQPSEGQVPGLRVVGN